MATVTIKMRDNPRTGKRDVTIHLESDSDTLAHEHEREHRALVKQLLGDALGDIHVERVATTTTVAIPTEEAPTPTPKPRQRA